MNILVPANTSQLNDRISWFKNPVARRLSKEKNVGFGFELKGEPETITPPAGGQPLYWGYHLPVKFAADWYYHPEKQTELLASISHLAALKPAYVNLHGIKLWWKPAAKEYIERYKNRSEPAEYRRVLAQTVELIDKIKEKIPQLTLENTILCDYYRHDEDFLATTSYQTAAGTLRDLLYLREKTGVELLLDLEHLILSLNFANRAKNYRHLKKEPFTLNSQEAEISRIYGVKIKKGFIPYAEPKLNLAKMIEQIGAKKYHLTGSTQDVINGKKDLTHGPIEISDKTFRKNLRLILAQKPETLLVETAGSGDNACYGYLRPNETELSFYNLCQILLEEL